MSLNQRTEFRISIGRIALAVFFFQSCFWYPAQAAENADTSTTAAPQEMYEGTVTKVMSSGTFLFKSNNKEYTFLLYGVDFFEIKSKEYKVLQEYLSEQVVGKSAKVVVVRELGDFKFVRLYSPDDMVARLIEKGFAPWDKALASDEALYQELELGAKKNEVGIWGSDAVKSDNPFNLTRKQRSVYRQQIKFLNFEAMLDRWSHLDKESRDWYRDNVQRQLTEGQAEKGAVISRLRNADNQLSAQQSENDAVVQDNLDDVSDSRDAEQLRLDEAYDDADLNWKKEQLESARDYYGEPRRRGRPLPQGGRYWTLADLKVMGLEGEVDREQEKVGAEAVGISREYEADRVENYGEMRRMRRENIRINAQRKRNQGLVEALSTNLRMHNSRLTGYISQINNLDTALEQKYVYRSTFSDFREFPVAEKGDEIYVPASLRFVVVTWDGESTYSGIDVYRGPEAVLFTRLFNNKPAYKRFYILEPGYEYVLKPKEAARIKLRYMEFKEAKIKG